MTFAGASYRLLSPRIFSRLLFGDHLLISSLINTYLLFVVQINRHQCRCSASSARFAWDRKLGLCLGAYGHAPATNTHFDSRRLNLIDTRCSIFHRSISIKSVPESAIHSGGPILTAKIVGGVFLREWVCARIVGGSHSQPRAAARFRYPGFLRPATRSLKNHRRRRHGGTG